MNHSSLKFVGTVLSLLSIMIIIRFTLSGLLFQDQAQMWHIFHCCTFFLRSPILLTRHDPEYRIFSSSNSNSGWDVVDVRRTVSSSSLFVFVRDPVTSSLEYVTFRSCLSWGIRGHILCSFILLWYYFSVLYLSSSSRPFRNVPWSRPYFS